MNRSLGAMQFRFYLIDKDDRIFAGEHFSASDDREAQAIAASLWEACSDAFGDYELWQGSRRVDRRPEWACQDITALRLNLQQRVVELEELLQEGFAVFERSSKLRKRYTELHDCSSKPLPDQTS